MIGDAMHQIAEHPFGNIVSSAFLFGHIKTKVLTTPEGIEAKTSMETRQEQAALRNNTELKATTE